MGLYKKVPYNVGRGTGVYSANRIKDKKIPVRHNLPGNIIVIHGVNDVGTAYAAVEQGLCEGLSTRLKGNLTAANYRMPMASDKKTVEDDPDAVFYKRTISTDTHSPVIPFYWGYRELESEVQTSRNTSHGQAMDRYANRLDKDHSKGGGPFANATNSIPDMWNKGKWGVFGMLDTAQRDATHPVLNNPGRMYMILAARRLAALIAMIRDYDENETVSIVAHSQGCLISLLAQAFLLDPAMKTLQPNARPADTLILNNPPYSLIEKIPMTASSVDGYSGEEAVMRDGYYLIDGSQTLNARLTTLSNIVQGLWKSKHAAPSLSELNDTAKHCGAVGPKWAASEDRDNRGKTYLYFCPEDMTVALTNVQGIGWQGVPHYQRGTQVTQTKMNRAIKQSSKDIVRKPFSELGEGFRQRVFTLKRRPDHEAGSAVQIGEAKDAHYFVLRQKGEDDQSHTAVSDNRMSKRAVRAHLPTEADCPEGASLDEKRTHGVRLINGEQLKQAVSASLIEEAQADGAGRAGASETVDPIDAAISVTSNYGIYVMWRRIPNPLSSIDASRLAIGASPRPQLYSGRVGHTADLAARLEQQLNGDKPNNARCKVLEAYVCLDNGFTALPIKPGELIIKREETADEARLRWQQTQVPRSFHGAIFSGRNNHRDVTAYDVAIGGGQASSDPAFYAYLCAVADWRLKIGKEARPGILKWQEFLSTHATYWQSEPAWRNKLIYGNAVYYTDGELPDVLPVVHRGLPPDIVCELRT